MAHLNSIGIIEIAKSGMMLILTMVERLNFHIGMDGLEIKEQQNI